MTEETTPELRPRPPLLLTPAQAEVRLWIRDAGPRIAAWTARGELTPVGIYRPPGHSTPVPLYREQDLLAVSWGRG